MIIKLLEAGDEIKNYNSFNSIELQTILKDNNLNGLSSKYELKFYKIFGGVKNDSNN